MRHQVFTESWAQAWAEELRTSDAYRTAATTWEGSIVLEMAGDAATARSVFVNLWHGECRDARAASETDREQADYLIRADSAIWKRVLAGDLEPIFGLMSGKLKLVRGSLAKLTPYMAASRELVQAAARVESAFPDD
ncbi:MAG: SCP2 sterol-binding domain-containing protein [Acidobacteriota bacterium]